VLTKLVVAAAVAVMIGVVVVSSFEAKSFVRS
jgi:hypothetical protein